MEYVDGCGVRAEPAHRESKSISCCPKMCQRHRFERRLGAEEQVVQWAEDEERPASARHGEQGVSHVSGPVTCLMRVGKEGQLQNHPCIAHGEEEYIGVRALRLVALPTKHRGIASLQICAQVLRDEVVSMAPYGALKCGVVDEKLTRVRPLST